MDGRRCSGNTNTTSLTLDTDKTCTAIFGNSNFHCNYFITTSRLCHLNREVTSALSHHSTVYAGLKLGKTTKAATRLVKGLFSQGVTDAQTMPN
ncbi:MAG: hypothetical protein R3E08_05175 [Thiotrichaceae bacterium]